MKQKKTLLAAFAIAALSYGNLNAQDFEVVANNPTFVTLPAQVGARLNGIGLITQLSSGQEGLFGTNDKWNSIGRLKIGSRFLNGFRTQTSEVGVTLGLVDNNSGGIIGNPFLQWIGRNPTSGDRIPFDFNYASDPNNPAAIEKIFSISPAKSISSVPFGFNYATPNNFIGQLQSGTFSTFGISDTWSALGSVTTPSLTSYGLRTQKEGNTIISGLINNSITGINEAVIDFGTDDANIPFGQQLAALNFRTFTDPFDPTTNLTLMRLNRRNNNVLIRPRSNTPSLPLNRASLEVYNGKNPRPSAVTLLPSTIFSVGGIYGLTDGRLEDAAGTPTDYAAGIVGDAARASVNLNAFGLLGIGSNTTGPIGPTNIFGVFSVGDIGYTGSLIAVSDKKFKKDIKTENTLLEKIMKINVVNYTFDFEKKETKHLAFSSKLQHGVVSQELENIFPELVSIVNAPSPVDENGKAINPISYKGVEYMQLIPILIKGMQEQQVQIETLTKQLSAKTSETFVIQNNATESEKQIVKANAFSLSQNAPNPFSEKTTITYTVPANVKKAMLGVFDLNGKMLLQYNLQTGKNQLIVNGNTLTAGMYLYTLIADGEEVLSKRMILTR